MSEQTEVRKSPETAEANRQDRPIEEVFAELEKILDRMQDPQVTLQESFALYEKGVQDIRLCDELLDKIEKKMQLLNQDGSVRPFDPAKPDAPDCPDDFEWPFS